MPSGLQLFEKSAYFSNVSAYFSRNVAAFWSSICGGLLRPEIIKGKTIFPDVMLTFFNPLAATIHITISNPTVSCHCARIAQIIP